ncbi:Slp family lipoprotein [Granulosicoccaceae sp. 1_MG-2023]|nr:Slp family lipoprotein [Granulosicoccaceae sp. 1_MG-2023]
MDFKQIFVLPRKAPAAVLLCMLALSACTTIPREVRDTPEQSPSLAEVRADPAAYAGAQVRWGGTIVRTTNKDGLTEIEIVARRLLSNTRPADTDQTQGRFIARFGGFLDPQVYAAERDITVVGTINGLALSTIGEAQYNFPVVQVSSHYLWREIREPVYPYRPYDPWHPYRPYYSPFYFEGHFGWPAHRPRPSYPRPHRYR